jgi:Zn-dependent alcohol dehydrogenase
VNVLSVSKDIEVQTGPTGLAGQASISTVSNQYSVPESASLTLLGLGLLGLAVAKRSKLGQLSL